MRYREELETFLAYAWSEEAGLYYRGMYIFIQEVTILMQNLIKKYEFHLCKFKAILKDDINCEPVWTDNYERIVDWNQDYHLIASGPEEIREKVVSHKDIHIDK